MTLRKQEKLAVMILLALAAVSVVTAWKLGVVNVRGSHDETQSANR